jgi:hypothetical protein
LEKILVDYTVKDYNKLSNVYASYEQALQAGVEEGFVSISTDKETGVDDCYDVKGNTELARRLKFIGDNLFLATSAFELLTAYKRSPVTTEVIVPISIGAKSSKGREGAKKPESIQGMTFADGKSIQDILDEYEGDEDE